MPDSALRPLVNRSSALQRIRDREREMPSNPQTMMPTYGMERARGAAFNTLFDVFGGNTDDQARRSGATRAADNLLSGGRFAADMTPGVGDVIAFGEAKNALREGRYGEASLLGGLGVLGMIPVAGKVARKATDKAVDSIRKSYPASQSPATDYRGSHQPPDRDYGASLDNLTTLVPEDVYGPSGPRLYGIGDPEVDREVFRSLRLAKGRPDAEITIYRAVPEDVDSINSGDWVTTSRKYADMHGENALGGKYKIIEQKARAGDLLSEGYPYEMGYWPKNQ